MFVFHLLCVVSNCKFDVIRWSKPYFRLIGGTDVAGLNASQVEPVLVTFKLSGPPSSSKRDAELSAHAAQLELAKLSLQNRHGLDVLRYLALSLIIVSYTRDVIARIPCHFSY